MLKSAGSRFLIVGLLAALMFIPMFFVGAIISDREVHSMQATRQIGAQWGGLQTIKGPALIVPVEGLARSGSVPNNGRAAPPPGAKHVPPTGAQEGVILAKPPLRLLPEHLRVTLDVDAQTRRRGIFETTVYSARGEIAFDFERLERLEREVGERDRLLWDRARLVIGLGDNRGLRGDTELRIDGERVELSPSRGGGGVEARIGDPRALGAMRLTLQLNGAEALMIAPAGSDSVIELTGDWPHPAFDGAFLPDTREVTDRGFSASWRIPNLARNLPEISSGESLEDMARGAMGVRFLQPNDFYQKAYRAAHYAVLFIALTFLTVLLLDRRERPAHPVQYLLIGLAQAVWVLLMVAYAEQVGFGLAYLGASAATIALITLFAWTGLKLGRRALVIGAALVALYAVLYLILRSADYALLAGATLAFVAVTATMLLTRNEDWYGRSGENPPAPASPPRSPKL